MYENRIQIRFNDKEVLDYLESTSKERNISINKLVCECIKQCMFESESQTSVKSLNAEMKQIQEKFEATQRQNEIMLAIIKKFVDYSFRTYANTLILLQGRFNEYKAKNFDASKFYNKDVEEIMEKIKFTDEDVVKISGLNKTK